MKFAFEIKTKPVTQAAIIIGISIIAFALGSFVLLAIYLGSLLASIVCMIILAIIVYLALRPAPC